ncbi:MAG: hypothetical protein ACW980_22480 [Promethearchaeota archaeon]|jgi:hypothetical protein
MFRRKKFGLKEAEAASAYTATEEQRRSVLGVLGVLGVKSTVINEAEIRCIKLGIETEIADREIKTLKTKLDTLDEANDNRAEEVEDINELVKDWVL